MAAKAPFRNYTINRTWDSRIPDDNAEIHLKISKNFVDGENLGGLIISVDAPYYNDPQVPKEIPVGSLNRLWDYEVVEVFLLSESENKYLEVELSPTGHYLLLELDGQQNILQNELPLANFTPTISDNRWKGTAFIPAEYTPANLNKFNAYAIHRSNPNRVYMSLFPTPEEEHEHPNFHRLQYFQPFDL